MLSCKHICFTTATTFVIFRDREHGVLSLIAETIPLKLCL